MPDWTDTQRAALLRNPPPPSSPAARATMVANRGKNTGPERRLRSELHRRGLRFRVLHPVRVEGERLMRPDIVFTRWGVLVFVDGCFWHGCPEHGTRPRSNADYWDAKISGNQARDLRQAVALQHAGWTVLRVWEHELPEDAADRIAETLGVLCRAQTTQR